MLSANIKRLMRAKCHSLVGWTWAPNPALRPLGSETRLLGMALPPCWPHRNRLFCLVGCLPVSRTQEARRTPASKKNHIENGPSPHQHWSCRYVRVPRGWCYLSSLTLTFYTRGQQTVSKAADSKYFRICEPCGLWGNCSTLLLQHKIYRMGVVLFQCFYLQKWVISRFWPQGWIWSPGCNALASVLEDKSPVWFILAFASWTL